MKGIKWAARLFDLNTNELIGEKIVWSQDAALDTVIQMERRQPPNRLVRPFVAVIDD